MSLNDSVFKWQANITFQIVLLKGSEYVHMRGEMHSDWHEISSWHENKFCSHDDSFRLHFKTNLYYDWHAKAFHFG